MPDVTLAGNRYPLKEGETVLSGLERHGVEVSFSCRNGVCRSCALRLLEGDPPPGSQTTLPEAQRRRGIFLSCCGTPEADLVVERCEDALGRYELVVSEVEPLNDTVLRLRLSGAEIPEYEAGQFMNLVLPDGAVRSYSLAGVPGIDPYLEFHIAILPGGKASTWAARARPGTEATVRGPLGNCTYVPGEPDRPLVLVGTGTGLAPLYGILRTALEDGHRGPVHLFHGSVRPQGLYLVDELRSLETSHPNVTYHPSVLTGVPEADVSTTPIDRLVTEILPSLNDHRVYLCGAPELVKSMHRQVFLAGAGLKEIHADAFLPAGGA